MMERHVKAVGLIQIIFSSLFMLACSAAGAMFLFMGTATQSAVSADTHHAAATSGDIDAANFMSHLSQSTQVAGGVVIAVALLWGIVGIAAGIGLLRRASWGRSLGIAASIMNILLLNPLHIGIGIYGLIVLTDKATVALFQGSPLPTGTAPTG